MFDTSKTVSLDTCSKFLKDTVKKISQLERQKITGGDVLLIEDFLVDMKKIMDDITRSQKSSYHEVKVKKTALRSLISLFKPKNKIKTELDQKKGNIIRDVVINLKREHIPEAIGRKVQRILEIENSFFLGFCESVKFNIDLVFRYLYFTAFMMQVAF